MAKIAQRNTYWIELDRDLNVILDACPVIVRRPGGTVFQIAEHATPAQEAELLRRHPGAILLTNPDEM